MLDRVTVQEVLADGESSVGITQITSQDFQSYNDGNTDLAAGGVTVSTSGTNVSYAIRLDSSTRFLRVYKSKYAPEGAQIFGTYSFGDGIDLTALGSDTRVIEEFRMRIATNGTNSATISNYVIANLQDASSGTAKKAVNLIIKDDKIQIPSL